MPLYITMGIEIQEGVDLDQFVNPEVKRVLWTEAKGFNLLIADNIVSLIRVLADLGFKDVKIGKVLFDFLFGSDQVSDASHQA